MLESYGFENGRYIDLTFGAIRIYSAETIRVVATSAQ